MSRHHSFAARIGSLACALLFLAGVLSAGAQSADPTLQTASLRLWPEYDDPGLLVIFAGNFSDPASFPRDVTLPLPDNARNVQPAYPAADGGLLIADATIATGQLTYNQLPVPAFHLEYYVDRPPSGNQREIIHIFEAPFAIETLEVAVQQPARATDFSLTPAAENSFVGEDGLTYYSFNRSNLAAGDRLEIVLRYTKPDSGVSSPQLAVTNASATPTAPTASATSTGVNAWLPWVLIGVGATALAALLTYWLLTRRQQHLPSTPARKITLQARPQPAGKPAPAGAASFCPQCGHPFQADDRFCAQCGAPRRR